ncbi:hypothetical protein ABPG75_000787 [Micractinium tetrahymenae]
MEAQGPFAAMPTGSALPGSPLTTVDYTFTDSELQSLLTSLDQGTVADDLLGAGPGSQSLQFLPHLPSTHDSPQQAPAVFVPADLSLPPLDGPPLPLPVLPPGLHSGMAAAQQQQLEQQQQEQQGQRHGKPPPRQQAAPRQARPHGQRSGRAAAAAAAAPTSPNGAAKPPHSFVEKQRRDRINSLIDELRELVPPQGSDSPRAAAPEAAAAGDCRRPKHVVLSDTIRLIKDLQLQVQAGQQHAQHAQHVQGAEQPGPPEQQQGATSQQHAAQAAAELGHSEGEQQPLALDGCWAHAQQQEAQSGHAAATASGLSEGCTEQQGQQQRSSGLRHHPQLPAAPGDHAVSVSGVVVEVAEGLVRNVKVTCPDRHGLLADLVRALKELPLEITTAAITTRRDNRVVYDVFQVELQDPHLPDEAIASAVEAALRLPGEKKRRQASPAAPDLG